MSLAYDCLENSDKEGNLQYWVGNMTGRRERDLNGKQNLCKEVIDRLKTC